MKSNSFFLLFFLFSPLNALYHGQFFQDQYVNENFFKNKKNGIFVDIGAHDGEHASNTLFFEQELGWRGICFEPLEHAFKKLQQIRPNSLCINACVAEKNGKSQFIKVSGPSETLSGLSDSYHPGHLIRAKKEVKEYGGSIDYIAVSCVTFNETMRMHNINYIDFLSIDTEGNELVILHSIDFDAIKIAVITVENNYGEQSIKQILLSKGYSHITNLGCDELYVNFEVLNKETIV